MKQIDFEEPDVVKFRGLRLAYEAGKVGGTMPTVYNAANEKAVSLFLERKINYLEIVRKIEECMDHHSPLPDPDFDTILDVEAEVRAKVAE